MLPHLNSPGLTILALPQPQPVVEDSASSIVPQESATANDSAAADPNVGAAVSAMPSTVSSKATDNVPVPSFHSEPAGFSLGSLATFAVGLLQPVALPQLC